MVTLFRPATRQKLKLRMALDGPSGAGKTYTALRFAFALGSRVAVLDTECGSASKYQGEAPDGVPWEFDVLELRDFAPSKYTEAVVAAGREGYDVLVIDSLSHAWQGPGGALDLVDRKAATMKTANTFTAWKDVTPLHNQMVDAMLRAPLHVIATMRSKMEYVLEQDERTGKTVPRKVGMAPIQRQGVEYEFDVVCDLDQSHTLTVTKSRCSAIADAISVKPSASFVAPLVEWLEKGVRPTTEQQPQAAEPAGEEGAAPITTQAKPRQRQQATPQTMPANPTGAELLADVSRDGNAVYAQIYEMFALLQIPEAKRESALAKRGVGSVRSLSLAAASELLSRLREMEQQRRFDSALPENGKPYGEVTNGAASQGTASH